MNFKKHLIALAVATMATVSVSAKPVDFRQAVERGVEKDNAHFV